MINLREYQNNAVSKMRKSISEGKRRLILCAPTGAGKTIIFCYMASQAMRKSKKVLIVTDRIELLKQAGGSLEKFNLKPIEIKAGNELKSLEGTLYVAMAQTLHRRVKKPMYQSWINELDLIILDEAHKQSFNYLFEYVQEKTVVIGATATPHREGDQKSLHEFYNEIIEVTTIPQLIKDGFLSKPESYGVPIDLSNVKTKGNDYDNDAMGKEFTEQKLYHGVYDNYMKLTPNYKAIIFAPNVDASKALVADFKSKNLPIEHLDANTKKADRKKILDWYQNTPNALISNVGILNAGFDCPDISVVILYRATKSLPLFLQMVGRGSRTTPNKNKFTILDFGNNIFTHGYWEEDRQWHLKKKRKKKQGEAPVKNCPECSFIMPINQMICPNCDHVFIKQESEEEKQIVILEKLSYNELQKELETASFEKLNLIAKAKNYKKSWIYHQLKTYEDLLKYEKYMNYKSGWAMYQAKNRGLI